MLRCEVCSRLTTRTVPSTICGFIDTKWPGPLKPRAASGLKDFDLLLNEAVQRAPIGELVDIMDVGFACAYLATPFARRITGSTVYVDGGVNIMA